MSTVTLPIPNVSGKMVPLNVNNAHDWKVDIALQGKTEYKYGERMKRNWTNKKCLRLLRMFFISNEECMKRVPVEHSMCG